MARDYSSHRLQMSTAGGLVLADTSINYVNGNQPADGNVPCIHFGIRWHLIFLRIREFPEIMLTMLLIFIAQSFSEDQR